MNYLYFLISLCHLQPATLDESADLEVLKYAEDGFSFRWTKEGSRRQIKTTSEPNVLTFQTVSEKDLGYYRCEVKEAERVILTVYRALYIDKSNNSHAEPSSSGTHNLLLTRGISNYSSALGNLCVCVSVCVCCVCVCL